MHNLVEFKFNKSNENFITGKDIKQDNCGRINFPMGGDQNTEALFFCIAPPLVLYNQY